MPLTPTCAFNSSSPLHPLSLSLKPRLLRRRETLTNGRSFTEIASLSPPYVSLADPSALFSFASAGLLVRPEPSYLINPYSA